MASIHYSPSPRLHAGDPLTPIHSPHHSIHSSVSSRTPIHTLTIHEYRKQQHTPLSQKGTPPGKTLRRKAGASALSDVERTPSFARATQSSSRFSRPLHLAQSAHQLNSSQAPGQQSTLTSLALRSHSAEPRGQLGSISSISTATSSSKVRYFNSRKRLPRPTAATGPRSFPLSSVNVEAAQLWQSPPPPILSFSTESFRSSGAQTVSSPSTFSLSRFPQPPHFAGSPLAPLHDDVDPVRVNALSYTTNAPATPPATPAIIHYRGTSFDLVNPHDSLVLHDIVTPSREYDSSEYLPLRSSEEIHGGFTHEMAPKRSLYGDLNAARTGIMRRAEDSFGEPNADLPIPPTPAAISPNSSSYTSPMYSPESVDAPSPLRIAKSATDAGFSLKQLTRKLTKKLGKSPAKSHEEELQDMRDTSVSLALSSMDGEYAQPLGQTYVAPPQPSYFPADPMSPVTPTSPAFFPDDSVPSPEEREVEVFREGSTRHYDMEPLTSMVPDDLSTQAGRMDESILSGIERSGTSKPYYDDLDSIYPSSSVYTGDDRRKSNYQQSLANRQSNLGTLYSDMDANGYASEYAHESLYDYGSAYGFNQPTSRPVTQELYSNPFDQGDRNTDTISKFIEQYNPKDYADNQTAAEREQSVSLEDTTLGTLAEGSTFQQSPPARGTSGISQFDFDLDANAEMDCGFVGPDQDGLARRPTRTRGIGLPPPGLAPLAPAFEYNEDSLIRPYPETSDMFSTSSYSYGDTRNLLQICRADVQAPHLAQQGLQPSSSYSQPEAPALPASSSYSQAEGAAFEPFSSYPQANDGSSPQVSQEVLDQAEQMFNDAATEAEHPNDEIPAMWTGRGSGGLLLSKKITAQSAGHVQQSQATAMEFKEDKADWETLHGDSPGGRESLDSIADYSSSEGTRNSLGLHSDGTFPSWTQPKISPGPSFSSPPRARTQPLQSSPQELKSFTSVRTAPETSSPPLFSSPPTSKTKPLFHFSTPTEDVTSHGAIEEPHGFKPWVDPYGLSDKETQELLASGPNDDIIIEKEPSSQGYNRRLSHRYGSRIAAPLASTPEHPLEHSAGLERENTFEKLSIVGPKGNLTGTPRGTGMHETGSSVADTSSPGQRLSSSAGRRSFRSDYTGFYAAPFPATGSITRIHDSQPQQHHEQSNSRSLSPNDDGAELSSSPSITPMNRRQHFRNSTTFERSRRASRAAVPGQTKLRHMVLAPEGRAGTGSQDTHFSKSFGGSERPSTSDTNTPLHHAYSLSVATLPPFATARTNLAQQHSPHLLCPERAANPDDEARRRKLSWFILAAFCLIPPCILLYRLWGDSIITSLTEGQLSQCTPRSKKAALIAGIVVNVGLVAAILVPILVAHALKAV